MGWTSLDQNSFHFAFASGGGIYVWRTTGEWSVQLDWSGRQRIGGSPVIRGSQAIIEKELDTVQATYPTLTFRPFPW